MYGLVPGGLKSPSTFLEVQRPLAAASRNVYKKLVLAQPQLIQSCDFFGISSTSFFTRNTQKTPFFIIFYVDLHQIVRFSRTCLWMFLVLNPMTPWLSLRGRTTMRGSLRSGGALFLVVTKHSSGSFFKMPLPFSTQTRLAFAGGHHFLLGPCSEMCHHRRH